jgi:hypothetical protein
MRATSRVSKMITNRQSICHGSSAGSESSRGIGRIESKHNIRVRWKLDSVSFFVCFIYVSKPRRVELDLLATV